MKIVCICDKGIAAELMQPMKNIPGCEVDIFTEEPLMDIKQLMFALRAVEEKGPEGVPVTKELLEAVKDAEAIITHVAPVGKTVIEAAPKLKYIGVLRTGVENVDLELCKEKGIEVYNAEGRNSVAVADMTVALMICEMRNIARGYAAIASGKWVKLFPNTTYCRDMCMCTVGIIGVGKIGTMVATRLKGFGCKIIGCDAFLPEEEILKRGCDEAVSMEELLKRSDFVTIHMRHEAGDPPLIGAEELAMMKPTGILINCARAGLVDTEALIDALKNNRIGGAGIDVYEEEPLPEDHPYRTLPNVTLTPHAAGTTVDAFGNSVRIVLEEFTDIAQGKPARNRIV